MERLSNIRIHTLCKSFPTVDTLVVVGVKVVNNHIIIVADDDTTYDLGVVSATNLVANTPVDSPCEKGGNVARSNVLATLLRGIDGKDGITPDMSDYYDKNTVEQKLLKKENAIPDLGVIRRNASMGATAVQPSQLANVATSGNYNDLSDKPSIPAEVTEATVSSWGFTKNTGTYSKPESGIPASDLAPDVFLQGEKGDTGPQGPQGPQGPKGDDGYVGDDGATFTPSVDSDGNLSWTNNKGLPNPATVNIKGPKGDSGSGGGGGIAVETDPVFSASPAADITEAKMIEWDNKVDKVEGKGLSTNDFTDEEKARVAEVENKADKNGRYLDLAAGYYVENVELSGEMKSGNLNAGGGISNSSSTHLLIDISNVSNDSTIRVSTTYNSEYTTLWALWEVAYDPATVNWKYLLDKGPLCSVAQSADIDLSRYEGRAPRYLYVAVGAEGNSASATVLSQTKNIAEKFDEVEEAISKVGKDIDGRLAKVDDKVDKVEDVVLAKTFLTAKYYDYSSFVKELYIYPQFIDADFVMAKCYRGKFYIRPQIEKGVAGYTWQAVLSLNELSDDNVYDIITTVDGVGNTPIGTKVGYVVFSDIVNLSQINDDGFGDELNISVISSLTYSPIILSSIIYDTQQLVNTDDIADGAITNEKMNYEVYSSLPDSSIVYKGTIEDLWIDAQSLVDANEVNVRCFKGDIIIRAFQNAKELWTFRQNIQSIKNGELCPIVVDEDIIGYIIFKDIDQFRSYTSVDGRELANLNLVTLPLSSRFHSPINIALSKSNTTEGKVEILLPSTINCVVGDELRIYYKSIVKATNASSYNVKVVSAVGKAYPKYYVLKASTIGTHTATFSITDNNGVNVAVKDATINVVSAMSAPTTQKNVLVFGASATASGHLAGELKRRLTETSGNGTSQNPTGLGLDNIVFVGRKQGTSVAVNQEATGGWSWSNYAGEGQAAYRFYVSNVNQLNINDTYKFGSMTFTITEINVTSGSGNIRCTYTGTDSIPANGSLTRATGNGDASIIYTSYTEESFNPFWNNGKLDFVNYANKYCGGSIDVIISHCGMNDMSSYTVNNMANLFTNHIKPFVRAYHSDFPNGKVIISTLPLPSPTGGMGANYGASATWNWQSLSLKLWEFARLCEDMCEEAEFSSYVYVADCIPTFDCETSYPYEEKSVNTRSAVTEHIGSNGVHPTIEGSYQVSDAIYMAINSIGFNESEPEIIVPIASGNNVYIPKKAGAPIATTTSARGVVSFAIDTDIAYELDIPTTGNEYAALYAFGQESTNGVVADGVTLLDQYGIGNIQPAKVQVKTENTLHRYLYVCYTLDGGMPTLRKL